MNRTSRMRWLAALTIIAVMGALALEGFSTTRHWKRKRQHDAGRKEAVLWRDPGNIRHRDLYYGPGSKDSAPEPPFRFVKEIKEGSNPKFEVVDARGVNWRVKLGPEAQAETAATRLVWAVGYNAEESYYFNRAPIEGLRKLSRGQKYVRGDSVIGARFEPRRDNIERGKQWGWSKNPYKGTRELNGLKTMMVLLNNWDTFKKNNAVLHVKDSSGRSEARYTVTDLGATLGSAAGIGGHRSKNNVRDFDRSRFVSKVENGKVKFDYNVKPKKFGLVSLLYPPYYLRQRKATNQMHEVPVEHAVWIGGYLAQLSDDQLRDTFRAAGYDRATTETYVRALRRRINELNRLRDTELAEQQRRAQ